MSLKLYNIPWRLRCAVHFNTHISFQEWWMEFGAFYQVVLFDFFPVDSNLKVKLSRHFLNKPVTWLKCNQACSIIFPLRSQTSRRNNLVKRQSQASLTIRCIVFQLWSITRHHNSNWPIPMHSECHLSMSNPINNKEAIWLYAELFWYIYVKFKLLSLHPNFHRPYVKRSKVKWSNILTMDEVHKKIS